MKKFKIEGTMGQLTGHCVIDTDGNLWEYYIEEVPRFSPHDEQTYSVKARFIKNDDGRVEP